MPCHSGSAVAFVAGKPADFGKVDTGSVFGRVVVVVAAAVEELGHRMGWCQWLRRSWTVAVHTCFVGIGLVLVARVES